MCPNENLYTEHTHICVSKLTIIGSDNGLSPGRRQAIIWTNAEISLIVPLGTNFSEIMIEIYTFSLKKMHLKMSSGKWRSFCLGLNVLTDMRHACSGACSPLKNYLVTVTRNIDHNQGKLLISKTAVGTTCFKQCPVIGFRLTGSTFASQQGFSRKFNAIFLDMRNTYLKKKSNSFACISVLKWF